MNEKKIAGQWLQWKNYVSRLWNFTKGGFKSEDTEEFFRCQNKYSKSLSWAENLNKLFTVLGGKFKFSAQDSDLEYLFWQRKNSPVSSDLKPPLEKVWNKRHFPQEPPTSCY